MLFLPAGSSPSTGHKSHVSPHAYISVPLYTVQQENNSRAVRLRSRFRFGELATWLKSLPEFRPSQSGTRARTTAES
eukprot:2363261-Amphidinium_carterae.1